MNGKDTMVNCSVCTFAYTPDNEHLCVMAAASDGINHTCAFYAPIEDIKNDIDEPSFRSVVDRETCDQILTESQLTRGKRRQVIGEEW